MKNWKKDFDKPSFWADLKPIQKEGIKNFISILLKEERESWREVISDRRNCIKNTRYQCAKELRHICGKINTDDIKTIEKFAHDLDNLLKKWEE